MEIKKKSIKEIEKALDNQDLVLESLPNGEIKEYNWREKIKTLQQEAGELKKRLLKLEDKYSERLLILKCNRNKNIPHDDYPYDFDTKVQKEFLREIKHLLKGS